MNCEHKRSTMFSVIMALVRTLLTAPLQLFIHKDFPEAVAMLTLIDAFLLLVKIPPYHAIYDISTVPCSNAHAYYL